MSGLGPNMRDFLKKITEEPGEWTANALGDTFNVRKSSVRRTLRRMSDLGLVRSEAGEPPERGGRPALHWYPVEEPTPQEG